MALSDVQICSHKPAEKIYKITDEKGLYLEVSPNGSKLWRYMYLYMGKNKRIALGRYPEVGLGEARRRRLEAREHLDNGTDPSANRKREKLIAVYQAANTFGDMAKAYPEKMVGDRQAETTISKAHWPLEQLKPIPDQPITLLKPVDVLAALKGLEAHGKFETARRCRSFASRVFRYAVATGPGETDSTAMLRGALVAPRTTHRAALLEPKDVGELLRAIVAYSGHKMTRLAMQVAPHVMSRPGELRIALWSDFDLEEAVWKVPAEPMKLRRPQRVPLSHQVPAYLEELRPLTGPGGYAFLAFHTCALVRPQWSAAPSSGIRRALANRWPRYSSGGCCARPAT